MLFIVYTVKLIITNFRTAWPTIEIGRVDQYAETLPEARNAEKIRNIKMNKKLA